MDRSIGQADFTKLLYVGFAHQFWLAREFDSVITQRAINRTHLGAGVVGFDVVNPLEIVDLCPEVVGMSNRSVMATIGARNHDGKHFTLGTSQQRFALHNRKIQPH